MTPEEKKKRENERRLASHYRCKERDAAPSDYETDIFHPQMEQVMMTPIKPYKGPMRTI